MTETADVVVYAVDPDAKELCSWSRGTRSEVETFCRRPQWPAKLSDHFLGVDDWGFANAHIVAATPSLSNWIGVQFSTFQREAGFTRVPALSKHS